MRKTSLLFVVMVTASAQGPIMSGSATLSSGIKVRFTTVAVPPMSPSAIGFGRGGISVRNNMVHRSMVDSINRRYFGYNLSAERTSTPGQYRVSIGPLSDSADYAGLSPVLLPRYPEPQTVKDGETIELDLLIRADGQVKIVDHIQLSSPVDPSPATSLEEPKNYTPDDGPLNLDSDGASVWIDGHRQSDTLAFTKMRTGATLWFYFPGRGRYILSLVPLDGFHRMGAIRDNVISFQSAGRQYEVRLINLILGSKGVWNLYGLHDPAYEPKNGTVQIVQGGVSRMENLLPKR